MSTDAVPPHAGGAVADPGADGAAAGPASTPQVSQSAAPGGVDAWLMRLVTGLGWWRSGFVSFVAGGVGATGHAPTHYWPATLLAVMVLVWMIDGAAALPTRRGRAAFWRGQCFGAGYVLAGMWWVAAAFEARGPEYGPFGPLASVALAAGLGLFYGAAALVAALLWREGPRRIAVFALSFAGFEYLRGFVLSGFPWNVAGHVWPAGGPVSQSAAVFGVWGLTFITYYAFAAPAAILGGGRAFWKRVAPASFGFAALAILFAAGIARLADAEVTHAPDVRLRVVQADISQQDKWRSGNELRVLERYLRLSARDGLDTRTHVIWPESALPFAVLESPRALDDIARVFDEEQMLLMGSIRRDPIDPSQVVVRNSFLAMAFRGGAPFPELIYDKARLVPFGEFLPLSGLLEQMGLTTLTRRLPGGFSPGPGPATIPISGAPPVSPQICYETIFPGFTPRGQDRPAWIVNVSNDAWYGDTAGPRQSVNQARYRAIEEGLPLVRAATGGVSGIIDVYGRMPPSMQVPFQQDGVLDAPLPAAAPPTLYAIVGDAFFALMMMLGALASSRRIMGRWF